MAKHEPRYYLSIVALLLSCLVYAQSPYEGDALARFIGKDTASTDLKNLENSYHCNMVNENHYLSNAGVELFLMSGALVQINLYKKSAAYGSFAGKLPRNISFGMSMAQVKDLLGTPTVAYNSGYGEFDMHGYVIACWFEGDHLSQLGVCSATSR
jgi:hypothetical protein